MADIMKNICLRIAYDGTDFFGFQRQSDFPSVQQTMEEVLEGLYGCRIRVYGAARTDAGVHARGQVINFYAPDRIPVDKLPYALKGSLPPAIVVLDAVEKAYDFSVRHDNKGKHYRYIVVNGPVHDPFMLRYAWYIRKPLDIEAMQRAANTLIGTHDFSAYKGANTTPHNPVKTMYEITVSRAGGRVRIDVLGSGFLYHMVRNIVGALVDAGLHRKSPEALARILDGRDRRKLGATAPAQGLFLEEVFYTKDGVQKRRDALYAGRASDTGSARCSDVSIK